jgi:hypothetical protein
VSGEFLKGFLSVLSDSAVKNADLTVTIVYILFTLNIKIICGKIFAIIKTTGTVSLDNRTKRLKHLHIHNE